MISSVTDTILGSIDNVGGALFWIFIIAAVIFGMKGNNGGNKNNGNSKTGTTPQGS